MYTRSKNLTTIVIDKSTRKDLRHISIKDQTYDEVVQQAIRITSILNKHVSEEKCEHMIKQIAQEAFE